MKTAAWEKTEYITGWPSWRCCPHPQIELAVISSPLDGAYPAIMRAVRAAGGADAEFGGTVLGRTEDGCPTLEGAQAAAWDLFARFAGECAAALDAAREG